MDVLPQSFWREFRVIFHAMKNIFKVWYENWGCSPVEQHLPSMQEALVQSPTLLKKKKSGQNLLYNYPQIIAKSQKLIKLLSYVKATVLNILWRSSMK